MLIQKSYYTRAWATAVAVIILVGCGAQRSRPLWPGSKYTEADRTRAMLRALDYIDRSAHAPKQFSRWGSDYLYCFYSLAVTARDPELRAAAARLASEFAKRWANMEATVPPKAGSADIAFMVFGWLPAELLGESDARIKPDLIRAAARFKAVDYLLFDPSKEPPPADIPEDCDYDATHNPRGATVCKKCGRRLTMKTKYEVLDGRLDQYLFW